MGSGLTLDGFEEAGSSFLCGVFGLKSSSDTSLSDFFSSAGNSLP